MFPMTTRDPHVLVELPYLALNAFQSAENRAYAELSTLILLGAGFAPHCPFLELWDALDFRKSAQAELARKVKEAKQVGYGSVVFMLDRGWSPRMSESFTAHLSDQREIYGFSIQSLCVEGQSWQNSLEIAKEALDYFPDEMYYGSLATIADNHLQECILEENLCVN